MTSWRTTVGGLCAALGAALGPIAMAQTPPLLWLTILAAVLAAGGVALLGLNARDNKVTSEQALGKPGGPGGLAVVGFLALTLMATADPSRALAQTGTPAKAWVIDFPEILSGTARAVDAQGGGTTFEAFAGQGFGASYSYVQYDASDSLWKTIVGIGPVLYCRKLAGEAWEFNPGIKIKGLEAWLWPLEPSIAITWQLGNLPPGWSNRTSIWIDQDLVSLLNALF